MSTSSPSPGCSAVLQDQRLAVAAAAETAVSGRQSVWSDEPFDASVLDGFEGNIKLNAKRLVLADGMGLSQASVDIALEGGKVEVRQLEGACLGGGLQRDAEHRQGGGGRGRQRQPEPGGRQPSRLSPASRRPPAAALSGEIKFSGKGTSPRGVLSVLQGSGTLSLGEAKLGTLWPGAIGKAVIGRAQVGPRQPGRDPEADAGRGTCRRRAAASRHGQRRDRRRAARGQAVRDRHRRGSRARRSGPRPQDAPVRRRLAARARSAAAGPPTRRPCRASR